MSVTFQGGLSVPPLFFYQSDTPVSRDSNHVLGLVSDIIGVVIRVPKTGTLHGFEFSASSGWTAGQTFRAGFMSVDPTTGTPAGTSFDQYGDFPAPAVGTWVTAVEDLTDQGTGFLAHVAGGELREVTAGELLFVGIQLRTAIGGITMKTMLRTGPAFPYMAKYTNSSGTWSRIVATHNPMLTLKYAEDITVDLGGVDIETEHVSVLGCLAHEDEWWFTDTERYVDAGETKTMEFSLPWDADCGGAQVFLNAVIGGTPATFTVALKDSGGTTLASCAMDGDYNEDVNRGYYLAAWETVALTANTTYSLTITVNTGQIAIYERLYEDAGHRSVGPGGPNFGNSDGNSLRQLHAYLLMVPQSAAAPASMGRPALCGRALTPGSGCTTEVPADPAISLDTPGTPGAAQALAAPATCGRAMTPATCATEVPADPAISLDTPASAGSGPAFSSALIVFGIGYHHTGALTKPTGCTSFAPAYCDAPTS